MKNSDSIVPLKGPDKVRKRPAVFFMSDEADGCLKMLLDLFDYAIQEYQLGHARKVSVTKLLDGSYILEDDGCGVPIEYNSAKGIFDWEEFFTGKFPRRKSGSYTFMLDSEREQAVRSILHCDRYFPWYALFAGTAASRYMNVRVFRDECEYILHFEKGDLVGTVNKIRCRNHKHGTRLHFLPDEDVFSSTMFDYANVFDYAAEQAAFNPGLTLTVKDFCAIPVQEKTFCYTRGFAEMLADNLGPNFSNNAVKHFCWQTVVDDELVKRYRMDTNYNAFADGFEMSPPYSVRFEVAFAYSPEKSFQGYFYNYKRLEHGGVLRAAVTESINKVRAAFVERDTTYEEMFEKISIIVSAISERTKWDTARQTGIANKGIYNRLEPILHQLMYAYFEELVSAQLLD